MNLYAIMRNPDNGKPVTKGAQEHIEIDLTVHGEPVGTILLDYLPDTANHGDKEDEWMLSVQYREDEDPDIIAQGNIAP